MIRFLCPTCCAKIQASREKIGLIGGCPQCGGTFVVPPTSTFTDIKPPPLPMPPPAFQPLQPTFQSAPRFAPPAPLGPITPFAVPPKQKKSLLLPIAIIGVAILVATFIVTTIINMRMDENDPPLSTSKQEPNPPAPQASSNSPNFSSNRPQPQNPGAGNPKTSSPPRTQTPSFTPTPAPRPSVPIRVPDREPTAEIRLTASRRSFPTKEIPTAPLLTPPVQVDNTIYFASRDGDLYAIDTPSMELTSQKKLGKSAKRLLLDGNLLKAEPIRGPAFTVLEFDRKVQTQDPEDVEANGKPTMIADQPAPPAWYEREHYFNQVVFYNGRYYQPAQTSIRVLEGQAITEFRSTVLGLSHWKIALLPSGPMGYDNSSIYELDEHLCPIRRIINLSIQPAGKATPDDSFLAGDGKTLCFVQLGGARKRMMTWSLDGRHKLREYPVYLQRNGQDDIRPMQDWDYRPPSGRLRAVAGGYLFCGREMIWMPAGEGQLIHFRPNEQTPGVIKNPTEIRSRYGFLNLTPPVIVGSKIIVGFGGGGIYVFDASAFVSAPTTSPSASKSP